MADTDQISDWDVDTFTSDVGNQQILEDILNDDVVTTDPKDVTPITEEEPPKEKAEKKTKPVEEEEDDKKNPLDEILGEDDDEDETSDEPPTEADEPPTDEEEAQTDEDQNSYSALAQDLIKLGVFSEDNDLEMPESGEELLQRFNIESQKRAQYALDSYLSRFGEDRKQLFDAIFNKNVDPKDYIKSYTRLENFTNLDIERESNQEKVVRQFLSTQGLEQEDVDEEVERLKEYGDLEKVSRKYHKVLVANEAKALQEKTELAEQKLQLERQREEQYQTAVSSIISEKLKTRSFDGIPLTPAVATDLQSYLTVKNWKLPSGETLTDFDKFLLDVQNDPQHFPLKVKIALLAKHNFDLTKIASKLKSEESDEIFDSLARQTKKTTVKKGKKSKESSNDDLFSFWAKPK